MYIIAGLGNPGREYAGTRHNSGYEAINRIADRYHIDINTAKFHGLCGTGMIDGQKVLLVKPLTYMNLSGDCIREACDYYKIDPEQELIVLCDDISLVPGQIRVRAKGSAGGHNGLKSIIARLGTQNFKRVKIGVGDKPEGYDLADWVLGHFPPGQRADMIDAFDRASRAAVALLTQKPQQVMNEYNTRPAAPQ